MKRGIKIGLAVVMIVSILGLGLIGCAKPAPAPAPTPAPTPAPAPTPEIYELDFSTHHAPDSFLSKRATLPFIEAVKERSGGRITIKMYWGQSLAKYSEAVEVVRTGVADMAHFSYNQHPALFPLQQVVALSPLMATAYDFVKIFRGVYDEYFKPGMDKLGLVDIGTNLYPGFSFFTISKPIYRIEDLKGLTVIAGGGKPMFTLLEQMGVTPLTMTGAEVYGALQKGVADGAVFNAGSFGRWKWYEIGKPGYWSDLQGRSLPGGSLQVAMNKTAYDSLPADLRKIIDDASWEFLFEAGSRVIDEENTVAIEAMRKYGTTIITWDETEVKRFDPLLAQAWDEWAKATDANGLPGSKLVAAMRALAAK